MDIDIHKNQNVLTIVIPIGRQQLEIELDLPVLLGWMKK